MLLLPCYYGRNCRWFSLHPLTKLVLGSGGHCSLNCLDVATVVVVGWPLHITNKSQMSLVSLVPTQTWAGMVSTNLVVCMEI